MQDLWDILEYTNITSDVLTRLTAQDSWQDQTKIVLVRGPTAVGKTTLVTQIGRIWEKAGGRAVVAEGDKDKPTASFFPLDGGFHDTLDHWPSRGELVKVTAPFITAGGMFLDRPVAAMITAGVGGLGAAVARPPKKKRVHNRAEQAILAKLIKHAKKRRLLLIADNLHRWDSKSLNFLTLLCSSEMRESYEELQNMYVLAAENPAEEQPITAPNEHDSLLTPMRTELINLPLIPSDKFHSVLKVLGAPPDLTHADADEVYQIIGGHLDLAKICAREIATKGVTGFIRAQTHLELIRRLVDQRMQHIGRRRQDAVSILQIASVIGQTFYRSEVECATSEQSENTGQVLRQCRDLNLISLSAVNNKGHFVHERIREHFLESGGFDRVTVHERLIDCLRELRPADYETRCDNAIRAEQYGEAYRLAAHASLARHRDRLSWEDAPEPIVRALEDSTFRTFVDALQDASDFRRHIGQAKRLRMLDSAPDPRVKSLRAEADFVRASILRTTRNGSDRIEAMRLLKLWEGYENVELEIGVRLMLLRLSCLSLEQGQKEALRIDERIRSALQQQSDIDQWANDIPYTLDRLSSRFNPPDISLRDVKRAVDYFGPSGDEQIVRRPDAYYRSLVNYVAELVTNSEYRQAVAVSETLDHLVNQYEDGSFTHVEYVTHNRVLAQYRNSSISVEEARSRQEQMVQGLSPGLDGFYVKSGLAVYYALTGHLMEARNIYDDLIERLDRRDRPEPSMHYELHANRVAIDFLAGNRETCLDAWRDLGHVVKEIPYPTVNFMVRRHSLLQDIFSTGSKFTPREFDVCLTTSPRTPLGRQWDHLGRGLRIAAIEWWS